MCCVLVVTWHLLLSLAHDSDSQTGIVRLVNPAADRSALAFQQSSSRTVTLQDQFVFCVDATPSVPPVSHMSIVIRYYPLGFTQIYLDLSPRAIKDFTK